MYRKRKERNQTQQVDYCDAARLRGLHRNEPLIHVTAAANGRATISFRSQSWLDKIKWNIRKEKNHDHEKKEEKKTSSLARLKNK